MGIRECLAISGLLISGVILSSCSAEGAGVFQSGSSDDEEFSIFDLVTECDLLAAHPEDNQRMADGVADDEIVPRLAIMACEDSLAEDPEDPRFAFQLGRSLLAAKRETEALTHLESAAANNYAAAHAYIGDIYQFGLGKDVNPEKAAEHYRKAADGKFEPAKGQIKQLDFDKSMYISRSINQFYDGEYPKIRQSSDLLLRNYVFNFTTALMDECDPFLTPGNLVNFYLYRYPPGQFSMAQEEDINVAIQTELGEHDASIFIERHGCEGPVAKRLFKSMNEFFDD